MFTLTMRAWPLLYLLCASVALGEDEAASQPSTPEAQQAEPETTAERNSPSAVSAEPLQTKTFRLARPRSRAVAATVNLDQDALSTTQRKPWSVFATTVTSFGLGTFVKSFYASDPYVDQSLYVEGAYVFSLPHDYRLRLSVREAIDYELTKPDNASGRAFNWSDALVGASTRAWQIAKVKIDLWALFRVALPISAQSQQAGLVTALAPSIGASRNFDFTVKGRALTFNARLDTGVRKNFHRTNVPVYTSDPHTAQAPTIITRASDPIDGGGLARGNASVDWSLTNALTLSFTPADWITLSAFAAVTNALKYPIAATRDAYTSIYAVPGAGRVDEVRTNLDVTFNLTRYLFLSGGIFTVQPPFAPNNRTLYNPLFNADAAANNYTTLYVSVSGLL